MRRFDFRQLTVLTAVVKLKNMPILPKKHYLKGQALLVVLLIMSVVLTVVLSAASRSVTEVSVTSLEEDALRAFSAAEAGIEEALLNPIVGDPPPQTQSDGSVYDPEITSSTDADKQFRYPNNLVSGETATFWLVSHTPDGQLTCGGNPCFRQNIANICFGNKGASVVPAIEALFFYDLTRQAVTLPTNNYAGVQVARFAVDPNSARAVSNNFSTPAGINNDCDFAGDLFEYRFRINVNNDIDTTCDNAPDGCPLLVKVRMYYASDTEAQKIGLWTTGPASNTPSQGLQISSVGTAGESTRRLSVFRGFAETPSIFDAAVFSLRDLTK